MITAWRSRHGIATIALGAIASAVAANLLFNLAMAGRGHPYSGFLGPPADRWGDLLKMAMGFPGPQLHPASWAELSDRIALFQRQTDHFEGTPLNHFHMLPLSTLAGLAIRQLLAVADPGWAAVLCLGSVVAILVAVVAREAPARSKWAFALLALIAYPTLFAIDRGHLFSLSCGIALLSATLRSLRLGRPDWIAILLFAVALNIRPNAGLIPLSLFLFRRGWTFRDLVMLGFATIAVFATGMMAASAFYPDYNLASLLKGLSDYSKLHVVRDFGQAYNSSLFGAFHALFGYQYWAYALTIWTAAGILAASCLAVWRRDIPDSSAVFLALSCVLFATPVNADYHLIVFLAPLVLLAREAGRLDRSGWAVLVGCCFLLAPKNYLFHEAPGEATWSWQVVANPAVTLAVCLFLLWNAIRAVPSEETAANEAFTAT